MSDYPEGGAIASTLAQSPHFNLIRLAAAHMSVLMDLLFKEYLKAKLAEMQVLPAKAASK
jgi:hypothetical protein